MRDPYWEALHAALDSAALLNSHRIRERSPKHLDIGDFAICWENPKLHYVFYEFLVANGFTLTHREQRFMDYLKTPPGKGLALGARARPCVILGRHGPGSFVVCFLASAKSHSEADLSPMMRPLSIPFGDNQDQGLRAQPPFLSRLLFALPVVRQTSRLLSMVRQGSPPTRQQLAYGELERARELVRAKVALFKANHIALREQEINFRLTTPMSADNRMSQPPLELGRQGLSSRHRLRGEIWALAKVKKVIRVAPHPTRNDVSWVLKHAKDDIADASRYLSSVVEYPRQPFQLPRPFYSPMLRASTAFIRRRIIP